MGYLQSKLFGDHCVNQLVRPTRIQSGAAKACSTPPGVQGKARSPVTYCSQQRWPGRVPWLTGAYHHRQYTAPLCLGVRGPA
eukprot:scaffold25422_cov80-Phaeocystis_antarctica.AAC.7